MKKIYDRYSDRLSELSEKNKCVFMEALPKRGFFDLSKVAEIKAIFDGETDSFFFPHKLDPEEKYYIGYPYLTVKKDKTTVKAPLLFYPVRQEDDTVFVYGPPLPNRALFLLDSSGKRKKLFDVLLSEEIESEEHFFNVLSRCNYRFDRVPDDALRPFDKIGPASKKAKIFPTAVLGRFPVVTEMQEDYYLLKKGNFRTPTLEQLLAGKSKKDKERHKKTYYTETLDASQEKALLSSQNNVVVFGPPGTGKSQAIPAVVGNALANGEKVLVVCQKKVALDVIYSRLGNLGKKAFLSVSPKQEKEAFFKALTSSYAEIDDKPDENLEKEWEKIERELKKEIAVLEKTDVTLHTVLPFGLTLREMYDLSCRPPKNDAEKRLIDDFSSSGLIDENYEKIRYFVDFIKNNKLTEKFIEYQSILIKNDLAAHVLDIDIKLLNEARECCRQKPVPFPFEKHKCGRLMLTLFLNDQHSAKRLAAGILTVTRPRLKRVLLLSIFPVFIPFFPYFLQRFGRIKKEITAEAARFIDDFNAYAMKYEPIKRLFDRDGYEQIIYRLTNGADPMPLIIESTENYLTVRALKNLFSNLPEQIKSLLLFCYDHSQKTAESMTEILGKIIPIRVYHELIKNEPSAEKTLASTERYEEIVQNVIDLRKKRTEICRRIALKNCNESFSSFSCKNKEKTREFLFQMNAGTKSIRQMFYDHKEYVTQLIPCVLTTPEAASSILPLQKELFDIVIFDESGQLAVESVVPSLFRAKRAFVAGDDKQLPPPVAFIKKASEEAENSFPESTLKARSLLDLAVLAFNKVHLIYHYRSASRELIDFSNRVFYGNRLLVAPNLSEPSEPPIRYINVSGKRAERKNVREADEVVRLADLYSRSGSVGIITFNKEQCDLISEKISRKMQKDQSFADRWDGFIKSIENVQGEEKDIVIFSVGFAPDKKDRIYARFGALGTDGGEKRLNVAVTRAKKMMIVVTSLDPEELPVSSVHRSGPMLLKNFLSYAKGVSEGGKDFLCDKNEEQTPFMSATEKEIFERLTQIGYVVRATPEIRSGALSMAIYDPAAKKYLLGLETDVQPSKEKENTIERDITRRLFLTQRGWPIIRIWTRDWWLSPQNVLDTICKHAEKARERQGLSVRLPALSLPAGGIVAQDRTGEIGK